MPTYAHNREALFNYALKETFEAGIALTGPEVKSVRLGNVSLKGAYVSIRPGKGTTPEAFLVHAHIGAYKPAATAQKSYDPTRERRLLLKNQELKSLAGKLQQKGLTIIPIKVYTKKAFIKVELALAVGKQQHDKRESIKKRETDRSIRQVLRGKHRD